jgi:ATP-dependent Clp protease ATP-binding subunit ClpB
MSLQSMSDIAQLARWQGIPLKEVEDAVRCFKIGATENPWRKDYLREKIRNARRHIEDRVKGQHQAVTKTVDILMRSVMGLTGAHARSAGGRPRGVLFFAGPTGVGKTELAKTLTQLLFGDERAYIRFDMSEFAEEHAATRLLGAPPGYIGYASGGELTNAVKQRPFSVILFDEIEKCHPRVLDKFLQILEDGRLTDGQGVTAYFTESVIIFTSNLGISVEDEDGHRVQNVKPGDPYDVVESRIRQAIEEHFKYRLMRPELLNRIGDNIVVFNYIVPEVAREILDGMLANITKKVHDEHKLRLEIAPGAKARIFEWCTRDLSNGGRGIGNALESVLVNPLARALFEHDLEGRRRILVADVSEQDRVYTVTLG